MLHPALSVTEPCDRQAHGTNTAGNLLPHAHTSTKRKKKASGSCDPGTELFPGEARGQGREEYLMQHGSPRVLCCHHSWADSPVMCIWGFRVTSGCQNFAQPGRKLKNVHFWTELSLLSHGKVTAGSDTSIVYGTELQEMSWLLNNHIKEVCRLTPTAAAHVTALLTSHFEINLSLMYFA